MTKIKLRYLLSFTLILLLLLSGCANNRPEAGDTPAASTPTLAAATATPQPSLTQAVTPQPTMAQPTVTPETVVSVPTEPAGFYVDGTKLYDVNGNEFIMRGINHAHTWYKSQMLIALDAIAATGANTVRIVLSDGQQWQADDLMSVKAVIKLCIERKMIAVLEVHDATGSNLAEDLNKAVDYFIGLKDALIGNEQYVIINIANEWYADWSGRDWADAYIEAIPRLREAGLSHTILVDSAGWGQYPKSIMDFGNEILNSDPIKNTMFAIHMYGTAGKNKDVIKKNIDGVRDQNLCVTIGEFGYKHSDGDVDEGYIMEYCNEIGVGYIGWSWKGNSGGVEYLDIAQQWDGSVLSPDWGENLINGEFGIGNTSKPCSVFD